MKTNFGEHMLNPADNHLFGKNYRYFHDWELKLMVYGIRRKPRLNIDGFPARLNSNAYNWFKEFDIYIDSDGMYTGNGSEQGIRVFDRIFFVDYCNHSLQLIIEWDEEYHYPKNHLRKKDIERQQMIEGMFSQYLFIRLREKEVLKKGDGEFFNFVEKELIIKGKEKNLSRQRKSVDLLFYKCVRSKKSEF